MRGNYPEKGRVLKEGPGRKKQEKKHVQFSQTYERSEEAYGKRTDVAKVLRIERKTCPIN